MFKIYSDQDDKKSLFLTKQQALQLELELNKSEKGHEWKDIGDKLYNFYIHTITNSTLLVSEEQYDYLENLLKNIQTKN